MLLILLVRDKLYLLVSPYLYVPSPTATKFVSPIVLDSFDSEGSIEGWLVESRDKPYDNLSKWSDFF